MSETLDLGRFNPHTALATACLGSLESFVREFWAEVPGTEPLQWNWHMREISNELQQIAERVFRGQRREHNLIINVSPGTSKPVWEDSMILMGDGRYKKLREVEAGDYVIGKSGSPCKVLEVHVQGELPCVCIKTAGGRSLYAALDHPIWTTAGWVVASRISVETLFPIMKETGVIASNDWTESLERTKEPLPCRCLTVEGNASFVVDGIIVHNSSLCSILFPAWIWARMPRARVLTGSHTDELVMDLSGKARDVIKSEKYRGLFPEVEIRSDRDAQGRYATVQGGERRTCTVAGKSPMGIHAHFIIIDDPLDPKKAVSEVELQNAKDFFDSVITTRVVNKELSVLVLIMQRLHEEDPTGHLLKKAQREGADKIRHVRLPAELPREGDELDTSHVLPAELGKYYIDYNEEAQCYPEGLMDPVRLTRRVLRARQTDGLLVYAGQFMQHPVPIGGGIFRKEYFTQRVIASPYHATRVRYWDRACLIGSTLVDTVNGPRKISEVREQDRVITRNGPRRVIYSGPIKSVHHLAVVRFSNGAELVGTTDHLVWTNGRGWVELCNLVTKVGSQSGGDSIFIYERDSGRFQRGSVRSVFVKELTTPEVVYDISVVGCHEFVANSILVHNSTSRERNKDSARTAGVLLARDHEGHFYIEHSVVGQWGPTERNRIMLATAQRDRARYGPRHEPMIWVEREGGSSGRDAFLGIAQVLAGYPVREHNVAGLGDKEQRADPWSAQLAAGNVWVVDNGQSQGGGAPNWDIEDYVTEHCVTGNTAVITKRGLVRADRVGIGDMVYTHRGRFRKVLRTEKKIAESVQLIKSAGLSPLSITDDHRVLAMQFTDKGGPVVQGVLWKEAGQLRSSKTKEGKPKTTWDAMTFPMFMSGPVSEELDLRAVHHEAGGPAAEGAYTVRGITRLEKLWDTVPPIQKLDREFGRFCGMFVTCGHHRHVRVMNPRSTFLSMPYDHIPLREELLKFLTGRWGVRAWLYRYNDWRKELCDFICFTEKYPLRAFFNTFGVNQLLKMVPEWVWSAPDEFLDGFFTAWQEVNYAKEQTRKRKNHNNTLSPDLAWGLRVIASRLGKCIPLQLVGHKIGKLGGKVHEVVSLEDSNVETDVWSNKMYYKWVAIDPLGDVAVGRLGNLLGVPVTENKKKKGLVEVWDIEVEEDHSYTTTGGCVHNCLFPRGKWKDQVDASSGCMSVLSKVSVTQPLRIYSSHSNRKNDIVVYIATKETLARYLDTEPALLVCFVDWPRADASPGSQLLEVPGHGLTELQGSAVLQFSDIAPAEVQDRWDMPVEEYGAKPEKLIMQKEHVIKLWALINKKRPTSFKSIILVDDGGEDRRAISVAWALCEQWGKIPEKTIFPLGAENNKMVGLMPRNEHVYNATKVGRCWVV